jgi:PKD repeat protein
MKRHRIPVVFHCLIILASLALPPLVLANNYEVIGWSDFGIDSMDSDYSIFSLWPPANTIHAQVAYGGRRLTNSTGITVTYQAIADPDGSINSTSAGKTEFWQYVLPLYSSNPPVNVGITGYPMPGTTNVPMTFNQTNAWFTADSIPMTPYDDAMQRKFYPLMRLILRTNSTPLATNDIVLPVSDEVNCRVCHASGTDAAAQPAAGWAWNTNPEHDYRLNILRLHDELRNPATYPGILSSNGYNPAGLYRTVVADGTPILCVRCHKSTLRPGSGFGSIPPLTTAMHSLHATVVDPDTLATLNSSTDRSACYHCHPGPVTHALRGVMGDAVATNGVHNIQCQSCHGTMEGLGATNRIGWIDLPDCQSCHTGTAANNNGQIRYSNSFVSSNVVRQAVNQTFATITNTAFGNFSLYRYSTNHSKLFCGACHNSPHAEFPADRNDNIRAIQVQGHQGMLSDCSTCHNSVGNDLNGGPHGIHEIGGNWVNGHQGRNDYGVCQDCHGGDEKGSILSQSQSDQALDGGKYGTKNLFRGAIISCYLCHDGSGSPGNETSWKAATAANVSTNTTSGARVFIPLSVRDANTTRQPVTVRVISQPANGTVGVTNWNITNWAAIYFADQGFVGTNTFTFDAWNTWVDSALYTGTIVVTQGLSSISAKAQVPPSYPAQWPAPFGVVATLSNLVANITYDWDFGDATSHSTNQNAVHTYAAPGTYTWKVISTTQGASPKAATNTASILIGSPVQIAAASSPGLVTLSWARTTADAVLEGTPALGGTPQWTVVTNAVTTGVSTMSVTVPNSSATRFFRLRKL